MVSLQLTSDDQLYVIPIRRRILLTAIALTGCSCSRAECLDSSGAAFLYLQDTSVESIVVPWRRFLHCSSRFHLGTPSHVSQVHRLLRSSVVVLFRCCLSRCLATSISLCLGALFLLIPTSGQFLLCMHASCICMGCCIHN